MEPCQGEPSPAERCRAPGELSGQRANKRGRRSGGRRKEGPERLGKGRGWGRLGAVPVIVVSRFSGNSDTQKLGSGRAEKSSEPVFPHRDHLQRTRTLEIDFTHTY